MITVSIPNIGAMQAMFARAPQAMAREAGIAVQKSIFTIEANAKREAPVNKAGGGGTLRQSISSFMTGPASGEVSVGAKYGIFVEFGTRPHLIVPKNKKVLAARTGGTKKGGQYQIFGKLVHHPGTKANPFFERAIEKSEGDINTYFGQAIKNALS